MPHEPPATSPRTLADAYAALAESPQRPLAGGTDLLVQLAADTGPAPDRILDLWGLDELRGIRIDAGILELGALTTYSEIRGSPLISEALPSLAEAAATVGAAQIQNRGTIGGNVMNASPAGDTLPLLLACDAQMILGSSHGERSVAAARFWPGYRRTAARADELLLRIVIPMVADRRVRFRKVGTRRAQAISKVCLALAWRAEETGGRERGRWADVRLALGSVAPTPIRASATEALLEGAAPTEETADRAAAVLAAEIEPIDDVRSTADYRRTAAARVLHRLIRDEGGW
jgi:CO/xanthine dehydrogenase FAD-binding subunit